MKVKDLKKAIDNLPDDMEVILQKDSEGNGYSPLDGADPNAIYIEETPWYGDVYDIEWTADEAGFDEDEWNEIKAKPKALILYPIN